MEAKDTVQFDCVCASYDFEAFKSAYSEEIVHCYECDAYNRGKKFQAEISFMAGIKEVVEFVEGAGVMHQHRDTLKRWKAKLEEWGIENA